MHHSACYKHNMNVELVHVNHRLINYSMKLIKEKQLVRETTYTANKICCKQLFDIKIHKVVV